MHIANGSNLLNLGLSAFQKKIIGKISVNRRGTREGSSKETQNSVLLRT